MTNPTNLDSFWNSPILFEDYLKDPTSEKAINECKKVAEALKNVGAFVIKDPRVSEKDNDVFIDMLEQYFEQSLEQKLIDARAELHYQVGVTPEGVEIPRCARDPNCKKKIEQMPAEHKAHFPSGPDIKWRYFHRIGQRPKVTKFQELNAAPVVPKAFPNWVSVMDKWGSLLLQACFTAAEMAAIGLGLPKDTFTSKMQHGPHLLAPTGSDLGKYGQTGQILAGYHQDLNVLTIHGKSRFPGLFIWLRNECKVPVRVPNGCLLLQAGMQMEYLTGGDVLAGYHEVVVTEETLQSIERKKLEKKSLWRISSTLFSHIASDNVLEPLLGDESTKSQKRKQYPPLLAGQQVERELTGIGLHADAHISY